MKEGVCSPPSLVFKGATSHPNVIMKRPTEIIPSDPSYVSLRSNNYHRESVRLSEMNLVSYLSSSFLCLRSIHSL